MHMTPRYSWLPHGRGDRAAPAVLVQVEVYERFPRKMKNTMTPAATRIAATMISSRKVRRTPSWSPFPQYWVKMPMPERPPEDAEVPDKEQGVHDRDPRHRVSADPPHHDVVQHPDEVGDAVLRDDRQHKDHHRVPDEFSIKH